jgi:hypothetical protein
MSWISIVGFLGLHQRIALGLAGISFALALGHHVPAAALLLNTLDTDSQQQLAKMHIFSAGFTSWFLSWSLFQIFLLLKHRWTPNLTTKPPAIDPLDVRILVLTLVLASLEWFNLLANIVPIYTQIQTSMPQLLVGLVSGLAGLGVLFLLACWMNRLIPGFGFWGLIALTNLYGFGTSLYFEIPFLLSGEMTRNLATVSILLLIACVFSGFILVRERQEDGVTSAPLVFSSVLLSAVVSQWLSPFIYLAVQPVLPQLGAYLPDTVIRQAYLFIAILVEVALGIIFVSLFIGRNSGVLWRKDIVIPLVILLLAGKLNAVLGGLSWSQLSPLSWVIVAYASSKVLKAFRDYRGPIVATSTSDEDSFDQDFRRGWRN